MDGKKRPTAWGHRFGPNLTCSECNLTWGQHQLDPKQCCTSSSEHDVTPEPETPPPKSSKASMAQTMTPSDVRSDLSDTRSDNHSDISPEDR